MNYFHPINEALRYSTGDRSWPIPPFFRGEISITPRLVVILNFEGAPGSAALDKRFLNGTSIRFISRPKGVGGVERRNSFSRVERPDKIAGNFTRSFRAPPNFPSPHLFFEKSRHVIILPLDSGKKKKEFFNAPSSMCVAVPMESIQGVAGQRATLPCNIQPREPNDAVSMVLWFKEDSGEPLYR